MYESFLRHLLVAHLLMIIAITGLKGSGKTTVAQYLQKKGFNHIVIPHFLSAEIRVERLTEQHKQQNGKGSSFDDVLEFERNFLEDEEVVKQQLSPVLKAANIVIKNDSDKESLQGKIDRMFADITKKYTLKKPSEDGFFMEIAQVVAKKSYCVKRKVGAVLVRQKRILALGFDDTPRHIKHCNENGCPGCNKEGLQMQCLCNHAEENVIVQAAYHGVSTQDATVYTTESPCIRCTQILINAGIKELVFNEESCVL